MTTEIAKLLKFEVYSDVFFGEDDHQNVRVSLRLKRESTDAIETYIQMLFRQGEKRNISEEDRQKFNEELFRIFKNTFNLVFGIRPEKTKKQNVGMDGFCFYR